MQFEDFFSVNGKTWQFGRAGRRVQCTCKCVFFSRENVLNMSLMCKSCAQTNSHFPRSNKNICAYDKRILCYPPSHKNNKEGFCGIARVRVSTFVYRFTRQWTVVMDGPAINPVLTIQRITSYSVLLPGRNRYSFVNCQRASVAHRVFNVL